MDNNQYEESEASIIGYFPKSSEEKEFQDDEFQYHDNTYIEKEILFNPNLEHRNLIKVVEFGINRNTCGPYEFGVQLNAKFFMNILREYYLKLNCERLNFIVHNRIIYIYGHYNQNLKIYTKINTHYINPDLVKIVEGHNKNIRVNFEASTLLKHLELHNFGNKESMRMYFSFNPNPKSKRKEKNLNSLNPFAELHAQQTKFNSEFNFDEKAIPGNIIIETQTFKCNIESNFAPIELCYPPQIPSSIYNDYILSTSIDKIASCTQRMNALSPLEIYCNHYICNFISNIDSENYLTYQNIEGLLFNRDNAINFCKNCNANVDESNLYLKMINFSLKKYELDALKIINKKTSVIHFYAGKKEKYYFTKETDSDGNVTTSVIICSDQNKPLIKDIEECCLYPEHWKEWIKYLSNILPKDCINELDKRRSLKVNLSNNDEDDEICVSTTNKRKKNKKKDSKIISGERSNNNNKKNNNNNIIINLDGGNKNKNDGNKENEFSGLNLYANNSKGNLKKISIGIIDKDNKDEETNFKDNNNENEQTNVLNNNVNPFQF